MRKRGIAVVPCLRGGLLPRLRGGLLPRLRGGLLPRLRGGLLNQQPASHGCNGEIRG